MKILKKPLKKLLPLVASSSFLGCIGPQIDTCIILHDLKTKHCVPADPKKAEFDAPIKAGDFDYTPEDWKTLMTWIEQHKK